MVVSVIYTLSNEYKRCLEQGRIPFQITYIFSYYLKEAELLVCLLLSFLSELLLYTLLNTVITRVWSASIYFKHLSNTCVCESQMLDKRSKIC